MYHVAPAGSRIALARTRKPGPHRKRSAPVQRSLWRTCTFRRFSELDLHPGTIPRTRV